MTSAEYMALVEGHGLGKVLGSATYVHADTLPLLPEPLRELVGRVAVGRGGEAFAFNVIKLFRREFRLSLLDYPGFASEPHPALRRSRTCDLATGQTKDFNYAGSDNPPILHRKEAMLPAGHRDIKRFAVLTAAEEALGLYAEPSLIGFRLAWERLLAEKGVTYRGHRVVVTVPGGTERPGTGAPGLPGRPAGDSAGGEPGSSPTSPAPKRHRTAIGRAQLSRPVQCAMEHGLVVRGKTVFDYGCGLGDDMHYLRQLGFEADGWDPAQYPANTKHPADVVNLGFVLNVIEDLVGQLSVILRIYVGCAELLYGDLGQVDLVKLHKRSSKVTLLVYDEFERKRLPELTMRVKVNLRNQHIDVFESVPDGEPEILYFKHRYVSQEHPRFLAWRQFSSRLERAGVDPRQFCGPGGVGARDLAARVLQSPLS